MDKIIKKSLTFVILIIVGSLTIFTSCEKEEEDTCTKYDAANKVLNVGAVVHVVKISKDTVPLENVEVTIEITYLPCGTDEATPNDTLTGFTDDEGIIETTQITNIVLNNKNDRILFYAIAPDIEFDQQNYEKVYRYYDEFTGMGKETIELYIYAK
ncbi:MAG: hypothetical protein U9R19_01535 [Bacteroidota bacterium]|nr:hypothetical protein [Bacteroidota bacterium]